MSIYEGWAAGSKTGRKSLSLTGPGVESMSSLQNQSSGRQVGMLLFSLLTTCTFITLLGTGSGLDKR